MNKQLRRYIVPNVFAMLGTSCYVLADTFFISVAEGTDGIAALNLVLPVYGIIYALGAMIGVGSATRFSLNKDLDNETAKDYFSNAVWWTLLVSCIFVGIGVFFPKSFLLFLGADEQIIKVGLDYIQIVLCFAPFFMMNYTFTAFVRNDKAPKIAMLATLASGGFNILFDYILMFPMNLGMAGAALATGLSPIVSMSICMLHFLSQENSIVFTKKVPSLSKLVSSCNLGVVALVGELSSGMTTLIFNIILLNLSGNTAVAAYGVIANIALVGMALVNGVSLGLQPVASSIHGKTDNHDEDKIYKAARKIALIIVLVLVVLVYIFTDPLISIFNSEHSIVLTQYATIGLRIYFIGFFIAAINIVKSGFYSAIGKARASMAIALSRGVIMISVMAIVLSQLLGINGVWFAFPVSEMITWIMVMLFELFKRDSHRFTKGITDS